jgi:hypothetical protein
MFAILTLMEIELDISRLLRQRVSREPWMRGGISISMLAPPEASWPCPGLSG